MIIDNGQLIIDNPANPAAQPIQRRRQSSGAANPAAPPDGDDDDGGDGGGRISSNLQPPFPSRPGITYPVRAPAPTPLYQPVSAKMTNCGAIGRDPSGQAQNIDFSKILGMASPGVEYVATSLETIFKLSRAPQSPYIKKPEIRK